jgi:putative ATPase
MKPLAEEMRPTRLEDWIGHQEVLKPGSPLYEAISQDRLFSFILYAPPGSGKTSLCRLIKNYTKSHCVSLSAVTAGVKDLKAVITEAKAWKDRAQRETLLFIDEIHRFNKSQQDALLGAVEAGEITLIGATTENPSYELNAALISRLRVFRLEKLRDEDIRCILDRAVEHIGKDIPEEVLQLISVKSFGDARIALNILEQVSDQPSVSRVEYLFRSATLKHDKAGEAHYQIISALIKSMRAGEEEAALYYFARLWEAGEDIKFIARRLVIFASEDVGNADLRALAVANAVRQAVEFVGRPECYYNLAQAVIFLSRAPKSREVGDKFSKALDQVRRFGDAKVPDFLVNANTRLDRELGKGRKPQPGESFLPLEFKDS